jgi:molybdate transport system ATP-binding protein
MKIVLLAAGAAAIALSAGAAFAAPTVPGPKQPIPYDQLNAYMKASPKTRTHKDWWSGETASTGTSANTSATASVTPSLPADTSSSSSSATSANPPSAGGDSKEATPQLPNNPPVNTPPGAVNPSSAATPGAPASTTPPK